jgi:hypothetical protein
MRIIIILLLLPAILHAQVRDEEFQVPCSKKINERLLRTALQSVVATVDLSVTGCHGDIFRGGAFVPNSAKVYQDVVVTDVPVQYTRSQIQQFLIDHNATETDAEENTRKALERHEAKILNSQVVKQILADIQDLISRIEALEAQ